MFVLMLKGVPRNISYHEMKQDLMWLPGVEAVHSLNIWSLTLDKVVVSVHLAVGAFHVLYTVAQKIPTICCCKSKDVKIFHKVV